MKNISIKFGKIFDIFLRMDARRTTIAMNTRNCHLLPGDDGVEEHGHLPPRVQPLLHGVQVSHSRQCLAFGLNGVKLSVNNADC